jgi:hypothetical protein
MLTLLAAIEQTGLSLWVRESPSLWAFPFILFLHTLGLALLAGISVGIDCWVLTVARRPPNVSMHGLFQVMWLGFGINAVSGLALLIAYPAKALTNPVFYAKILLIVLAMIILELQKQEVFTTAQNRELTLTSRARLLAVMSLVLWAGAILTGRLLAYTHSMLLTSDTFF